jgi:ATP-dependent Clp protease ATP-binding subunit ClpA
MGLWRLLETQARYRQALDKLFPPELRGRIDDMVVFNHLDEKSYRKILEIELRKIQKGIAANGVRLRITPSAKKAILSKGISKELGARDLSHYVRDVVSKPLSKLIIKTDCKVFVCRGIDNEVLVESDEPVEPNDT